MASVSILKDASEQAAGDIADLMASLRGDTQSRGTLDELKLLVADPDVRIFVAEDGGKILGVAFLFIHNKFGKRTGYVEDVVVSEASRGQGFGRKLMEALIGEARASGISSLSLTSRPAREAANALYQKLGFEKIETNPYKLVL